MDMLFSENDLRAYFDQVERAARRQIEDLSTDQLQAVDDTIHVERVLASVTPHPPLLRRDQEYALEPQEVELRVMDLGQEIRRVVTRVTVVVPFEGDRDLFVCRPSSYSSIFPRADLHTSELHFAYDLHPGTNSDTRAAVERDLELVERYLQWVRADVEVFVLELRRSIREAVAERTVRLASATAALGDLDIPIRPRDAGKAASTSPGPSAGLSSYDAFLSHAGEDGEFAKELAEELTAAGCSVWFAPLRMTVGDSLNQEINRGLRDARFGIVVLSVPFFEKPWPQYELGALLAREMNGQKVILPVWRNLTREHVLAHQPALADKFALASPPLDVAAVANELQEVLKCTEPGA